MHETILEEHPAYLLPLITPEAFTVADTVSVDTQHIESVLRQGACVERESRIVFSSNGDLSVQLCPFIPQFDIGTCKGRSIHWFVEINRQLVDGLFGQLVIGWNCSDTVNH